MFEVLLKIGYGDADVRFLVVNPVKPELLKQSYHLVLGAFTYHNVSANIKENMSQTDVTEQAAKVSAPVLPLPVERRNKYCVGVDLQSSLAEYLWTVTSAQVEDLESRFLQGKLHNSIADYVNVIPNYADDDSPFRNARHCHLSDLNGPRLDTLRLGAKALESSLFDRLAVQLSGIARDREALEMY
jgi:nitrogen fixation-related uncharacterized protein